MTTHKPIYYKRLLEAIETYDEPEDEPRAIKLMRELPDEDPPRWCRSLQVFTQPGRLPVWQASIDGNWSFMDNRPHISRVELHFSLYDNRTHVCFMVVEFSAPLPKRLAGSMAMINATSRIGIEAFFGHEEFLKTSNAIKTKPDNSWLNDLRTDGLTRIPVNRSGIHGLVNESLYLWRAAMYRYQSTALADTLAMIIRNRAA